MHYSIRNEILSSVTKQEHLIRHSLNPSASNGIFATYVDNGVGILTPRDFSGTKCPRNGIPTAVLAFLGSAYIQLCYRRQSAMSTGTGKRNMADSILKNPYL